MIYNLLKIIIFLQQKLNNNYLKLCVNMIDYEK